MREHFFGGRLFALSKPGGGLRPIAVGMTLRRLVAKVANKSAVERCAAALAPHQVGVGVRGGCEAAVHTARSFLEGCSPNEGILKIDFRNAFNTVRRDVVLECVAEHLPDLLPFVASAYAAPSRLLFGEFVIQSEEGVQQGDPLGPLLFCLAVIKVVEVCEGDLVVGYLDDLTIGGDCQRLLGQVPIVEAASASLGLHLNHSKCEFVGEGREFREGVKNSGIGIPVVGRADAMLLGSPLMEEGLGRVLEGRQVDLQRMTDRLHYLSRHEGLFLLRSSLGVPRMLHLLRSSPCFLSERVGAFDEGLRAALTKVTNCHLSQEAWGRATLPTRWGGLGVRSASELALPAYLASVAASADLVAVLLTPLQLKPLALLGERAEVLWRAQNGGLLLPDPRLKGQRWYDDPVCGERYKVLLAGVEGSGRASMLAARAPGSGCWLEALPSPSLGLRLGDRELSIAVGLRLGCPVVGGHVCRCGAPVAPDGHHGLSCRRSAGRQPRHASINLILALALRSSGVPTQLEPGGLLAGDARRPDGATMVPWEHGRCLAWDFTCPDTVAPSHLLNSSIAAGSAALAAESLKRQKYAGLASSHIFVPVVVETLGVWGGEAALLVGEIGRRQAVAQGEPRAGSFLRQRISIAMQRGNAISVMGTMDLTPLPGEDGQPEGEP